LRLTVHANFLRTADNISAAQRDAALLLRTAADNLSVVMAMLIAAMLVLAGAWLVVKRGILEKVLDDRRIGAAEVDQ
jgi:hypothetical protein